jgi:hypothetical protein
MDEQLPTIEDAAGQLFGRVRREYMDGLAGLHEEMTFGFKRTGQEFRQVREQMTQLQNRFADRFTDVEMRIDDLGTTLRGEMAELGTTLRGEMAELGTNLRGEMAALGDKLTAEIRAERRRGRKT